MLGTIANAGDRPGRTVGAVADISIDPGTLHSDDLRSLCKVQFDRLDEDERLYLRYRTDGAATTAMARKMSGVKPDVAAHLDSHVCRYFFELRRRRPSQSVEDTAAMYADIAERAKARGNLVAEIAAVKALAECTGSDKPASDSLLDLRTRGTAAEMTEDLFRKVAEGSLSADQAAKLMQSIGTGVSIQLAQEERQQQQRNHNDNPHESGSVPFAAVELMKRQSAVLDKLLAARSKIPLEIQHNEE